ncbi:hypothetical protein [Acetivibrio clariflavus]|uniref:DUF4037 domain-containing protein n=1 Tax=Acetivibrio clariflavus (strain DSM 19732 / NBRC 101661 / EBR45) TaxID=720554 RepID=G8LYK5_ACECE|nr:hypothetical protein [Acetivibrio clariflavus]AEV69993.1 hypothetical protein Clocl_3514 [Acetivibrio clariflavus DSM 19732]
MGRPYVDVKRNNISDVLLKHLNDRLPEFISLPGVVGITLNGGLSRGFADHLSEIDITIFLEPDTYKYWQENKTPITLGIVVLDGVLYDIKVLDFEREKEKKYGEVELWDLSYSKILYDPHNKIAEMYENKLSNKLDVSRSQSYLFGAWWSYKLAGDIWISRDDALQGHFTLNESIPLLLKALYAANNEYIPHEKWIIHMSRTLEWKPIDWEERLGRAMSTGDLSINSLIDRQNCIEKLWLEIDNYIRETYYPDLRLKVMQKSFYELMQLLVQNQTVSVSEWNKKSSIAILNGEPFYRVTEIKNGYIILNMEKLLGLSANDMYYWHYEIVKDIVDNLDMSKTNKDLPSAGTSE